ncbi:MAG TPA: peptide chain release factor 1 [Clostridiales bacterium UBA8153]|nr:peptide chain release factor 1 [Clostridiales bacterium UBA8153]
MFERLDAILAKHAELESLLAQPGLAASPEYARYAREHARLEELVLFYRALKRVHEELKKTRQMLQEETDPELRELAGLELAGLLQQEEELVAALRRALLPEDPNDHKNVIVEIRAGTGGGEAALFAGVLYRMYGRYAEIQGWRTELVSSSPTDLGGFKEVIMMVEGQGAYSRLKFESGVHRVQRIPVTEAGGRIHTSTATVAVLPEAEEVEVDIHPDDLRIDVFCASGPGGQSVNTTYSAVRITHLPSGLVVSCQDEKSQHKNKERAMRVLRARLLDLAHQAQHAELAEARRSQVGTGDRSERIRTYNFPQSRVTDHRIGLTSHRLEAFLSGELDELVEALRLHDQAQRLQPTG